MANVPNLLSAARLLLVPVLLLLAWADQRHWFLPCLVVSLVTDAADGFLARKLNQATELGAKLDSWADFLTYLSFPLCAWWLWPDVVQEEAAFLTALIFCYLLPVAFGFLKFRRLTSYHTVANKVLAVLVAAAALGLLGWGVGWPFRVLLPLVAIAGLEEIAITIVLPKWRANVPSLRHALKLREATQPGEQNRIRDDAAHKNFRNSSFAAASNCSALPGANAGLAATPRRQETKRAIARSGRARGDGPRWD